MKKNKNKIENKYDIKKLNNFFFIIFIKSRKVGDEIRKKLM